MFRAGPSFKIERSQAMPQQLESIGLRDTGARRQLLTGNLKKVFRQSGVAQADGRILRESLLMRPNGGLKVQSIWEEDCLITFIVHGGGQ